MKHNVKSNVFIRLAMAMPVVMTLISACNPVDRAVKAATALKKTNDSLMTEFKKVNESIRTSDSLFKAGNDSLYRLYDSIIEH